MVRVLRLRRGRQGLIADVPKTSGTSARNGNSIWTSKAQSWMHRASVRDVRAACAVKYYYCWGSGCGQCGKRGTQLADRAVTAEVVRQWQHQALLVCRVPNLRGHDAQLIVGCESFRPSSLRRAIRRTVNKVIRFASSKQGVRILRGSNAPDQEEVSDWIQWAQNCRAVRAA